MLFVDLVGFTAQSEALDPEDVQATQRVYYSTVRAALERYGGTVEKFIGDAVMACFGAPVAHEDDPNRAVFAAFGILDSLRRLAEERPGPTLRVRIGINTGEAVVSLGPQADTQGMVSGDVVNVAARLQGAAPPDGILVGDATHRATRDFFDYVEQTPIDLKGKSAPVAIFQPVGPISRFGVDIEHTGAPLVGRDAEMAMMTSSYQRAVREHSPQLVTLVGAPGIGKSRLVWELRHYTNDLPDITVWRQGRCLPYGEGVTFWALGEIVKAQAGILETDSAELAAERLRRSVHALFDDAATAEWMEQRLSPLVGLAGEPGRTMEQTENFAAWRRFLEALGRNAPAVFIFEDLHWADDGLLDFLDELVDRAVGASLLVLCTARPEILDRRPGWSGGKRNAVTVSLSPLSDRETAALFAGLLGQAVLPAETQQTLLALAGGNALYAEEYVRMLADRGTLHRDSGVWGLELGDELPLPESIQGIIASRLDSLPAEEKFVLQDAAVVGEVFWVGALAEISGARREDIEEWLRQLARRELVRPARVSSVADETEYSFHHVLVRDVAYSQIPRSRRAEQHRRAAEWLEGIAADRNEHQAEMLAHHWLVALDLAAALGLDESPYRERARLALRAAGERAFRLQALGPALAFLGRALELWPPGQEPDKRWHLVRMHEEVRFLHREDEFYAEDGIARLRWAADALLALGQRVEAAHTETLLGSIAWFRAESDSAFAHLKRAVALLEGEPASAQKASAYAELAKLHMLSLHHAEAAAAGQIALDIADELGLLEVRANVMVTVGTAAYTERGDFSELEAAVELCREHSLRALHRAANNLAVVLQEEGDLRRSYEVLAESERAERGIELGLTTKATEADLAIRAYWEGDWDTTLSLADQILDGVGPGTPHPWEGHLRALRAFLRALRQEPIPRDIDHALELALGSGFSQLVRPTLAHFARVYVEQGEPARALSLLDQLYEDWRDQPQSVSRAWLHQAVETLAMVDLERLEQTLDRLRTVGRPTLWVRAAIAFGDGALAESAGRLAEAGASYATSSDIYAQIGDDSERSFASLAAGRTLAVVGQPRAQYYLEQARMVLHRNRASSLVEVADTALKSLGVTPYDDVLRLGSASGNIEGDA